MLRNKTNKKSKQTKITRRKRNVSSAREKEITLSEKITLYLNEALSIENCCSRKAAIANKADKN